MHGNHAGGRIEADTNTRTSSGNGPKREQPRRKNCMWIQHQVPSNHFFIRASASRGGKTFSLRPPSWLQQAELEPSSSSSPTDWLTFTSRLRLPLLTQRCDSKGGKWKIWIFRWISFVVTLFQVSWFISDDDSKNVLQRLPEVNFFPIFALSSLTNEKLLSP